MVIVTSVPVCFLVISAITQTGAFLSRHRNNEVDEWYLDSACVFVNQSSRIQSVSTQLCCRPRQLPSIEEAWRLPIPAELTSRQNNAPGAVPQPVGTHYVGCGMVV